MVGMQVNGEDTNFDPRKVRSDDDVKEAVDAMIDATLGVMAESGGDMMRDDREPVLLDLVNMFDERVRVLEEARDGEGEESDIDGLEASLGRWIVARDRAVQRYEGETGRTWERAAG